MALLERSYQVYGVVALILTLTTTVLAAISIATPHWKFSDIEDVEYGLFESCITSSFNANCRVYTDVEDFINVTRAFIIMGCIFIFIAIPIAAIQALGKFKKKGHIILGTVLLVTCAFFLIACSVYTAKMRNALLPGQEFGYSLWMAWAACIISLLAAPFGFLSKREGYGFV